MNPIMIFPLIVWLVTGLTSTISSAAASSALDTFNISNATEISKPGCPTKCGNLTVPYPFGIGSGCAVGKWFQLNCTDAFGPPRTLIGNIQVYEISDNRMRVSTVVSRSCYDEMGALVSANAASSDITGTPFTYSDLNELTIVGCDDLVIMTGGSGRKITSGCVSACGGALNVSDGDCSGIGCCHTSMPKGLQYYHLGLDSLNNHTRVSLLNPCGYAFLAEMRSFSYQATDLLDSNFEARVRTTVSVALDWAIGNLSCAEVKNTSDYACKDNSHCVDSDNGLGGYRCSCNSGYQGNSYLDPGCVVNKCADPNLNNCEKICISTLSSFSCSCPSGEYGDGRKNGTGCIAYNSKHHFPLPNVAIGAGFGCVFIVIVATCLRLYIKKKEIHKLREKFFKRNGGFILKQRISLKQGLVESMKIFTVKELKIATNDYADNRIIGRGGFGTVYKGILPDECVVAVKKSTMMDENQIEQFINEVIILTQINHRNVVKLLGCCLESEVPILVYEYISNGTLFDHIHNNGASSMDWLSWENRLRIASEAAGALSYLHSAASTPIIHRDVKSSNILIDESYTAKISDFGASRLIPLDQKKVTTMVIGTFGYLDPEYFHTSHLTEKSDVYSFGVMLVELLTGEKPVDMKRSEEQRSLAAYFITCVNENRFFQILEPRVVREGKIEQLEMMAELIKGCLHLNREYRPTMKEVAVELETLRKLTQKSGTHDQSVNEDQTANENETGFNDLYTLPFGPYDSTREFSTSSRVEDMKCENVRANWLTL